VWQVPLHSNASANHVLGVASPQFELSQYIAEVQHNTHLLRPRVFLPFESPCKFASWRKMHIRISNVFVQHNLFLSPFVTTHPLWVFALLALSPLCWVLWLMKVTRVSSLVMRKWFSSGSMWPGSKLRPMFCDYWPCLSRQGLLCLNSLIIEYSSLMDFGL
jgi:hypothetical protein